MRDAAEALRLTAQDLQKLGVIDRIVAEPVGGAQRDPKAAIAAVGEEIAAMLNELSGMHPADLVKDRRQKFLKMGAHSPRRLNLRADARSVSVRSRVCDRQATVAPQARLNVA